MLLLELETVRVISYVAHELAVTLIDSTQPVTAISASLSQNHFWTVTTLFPMAYPPQSLWTVGLDTARVHMHNALRLQIMKRPFTQTLGTNSLSEPCILKEHYWQQMCYQVNSNGPTSVLQLC